jgi:hypothetical protein
MIASITLWTFYALVILGNIFCLRSLLSTSSFIVPIYTNNHIINDPKSVTWSLYLCNFVIMMSFPNHPGKLWKKISVLRHNTHF